MKLGMLDGGRDGKCNFASQKRYLFKLVTLMTLLKTMASCRL